MFVWCDEALAGCDEALAGTCATTVGVGDGANGETRVVARRSISMLYGGRTRGNRTRVPDGDARVTRKPVVSRR